MLWHPLGKLNATGFLSVFVSLTAFARQLRPHVHVPLAIIEAHCNRLERGGLAVSSFVVHAQDRRTFRTRHESVANNDGENPSGS